MRRLGNFLREPTDRNSSGWMAAMKGVIQSAEMRRSCDNLKVYKLVCYRYLRISAITRLRKFETVLIRLADRKFLDVDLESNSNSLVAGEYSVSAGTDGLRVNSPRYMRTQICSHIKLLLAKPKEYEPKAMVSREAYFGDLVLDGKLLPRE